MLDLVAGAILLCIPLIFVVVGTLLLGRSTLPHPSPPPHKRSPRAMDPVKALWVDPSPDASCWTGGGDCYTSSDCSTGDAGSCD